jgi:hypothetical protein
LGHADREAAGGNNLHLLAEHGLAATFSAIGKQPTGDKRFGVVTDLDASTLCEPLVMGSASLHIL